MIRFLCIDNADENNDVSTLESGEMDIVELFIVKVGEENANDEGTSSRSTSPECSELVVDIALDVSPVSLCCNSRTSRI